MSKEQTPNSSSEQDAHYLLDKTIKCTDVNIFVVYIRSNVKSALEKTI